MPQGPYSRIVIERPDGSVDIVGRPGIVDPHDAARTFSRMGAGRVAAVRHEHLPPESLRHETLAIHTVKG